jgi:plastocyanin
MKISNRRRRLRVAFVAVTVTFWAVAAAAPAGTIKGTVRFAGTPPPNKKFPVTIDQYLCGTEKSAQDLVLSSSQGIRNAVVALQGVPPSVKASKQPPATVMMDQKACVFVPRVVVVPVGGTVEFLNSDRLLHNVRSDAKENRPFNRAQPHARTIAITMKSPEILRVDCDLHSWMRGWVVVSDHRFYVVTNDAGEFIFENIPAGKYTLEVWQEILGRVSQEVIVADGVRDVTVRMSKN